MALPINTLKFDALKIHFVCSSNHSKNDYTLLDAKCVLCDKKVTFSNRSSFNLKRHLQTTHPQVEVSKKRKIQLDPPSDSNFFAKRPRRVTKEEGEELILNFVTSATLSYRTVENPQFVDMIKGFQPDAEIPKRKRIAALVRKKVVVAREAITASLNELDHVAAAADIWTGMKRSYLGLSIHFIDRTTLERRYSLLACRRMKGIHDYEAVAGKIMEVLKEFGVESKTKTITTDNASNFAKAFRVFGPTNSEDEETETDEDSQDEGELESENLADILEQDDGAILAYDLPDQARCASHTLSLIATQDSKAVKDVRFNKRHDRALRKLNTLWVRQSRSPKAADIIMDIITRLLLTPGDTRWNSLFDSIACILKLKESQIVAVMLALNISPLDESDFEFLRELHSVMKPLAMSLDILQGETSCYFGVVLPTLYSLQRKLISLAHSGLKFCAPLATIYLDGLNKRFGSVWFKREYVLASVSHPMFQIQWIKNPEKEAEAKNMLISEFELQNHRDRSSDDELLDEDNEREDSIFDFKSPAASRKKVSELDQYFSAPSNNLTCLNDLPTIRKIFIKYNTAVPSSGTLERAFCTAGSILCKKRGKLSDRALENLMLLKFHKNGK